MSEEYLWGKEGSPDPEIARLEEALRPLRYQPDCSRLVWPVMAAKPVRNNRRWAAALALAAGMILTVSLVRFSFHSGEAPAATGWKVSWNESTWNESTAVPVRRGQLIQTGSDPARLRSDYIGEVTLSPGSRLRVLQTTTTEQRLALERGTIHALIWAPPRQFVVDTPSAKTIDLGCQYTLQVSSNGAGMLNVQTGWVAFQWRDLESFIPAGAACATFPKKGPGTPYFTDAPAALRAAIAAFDANGDFHPVRDSLASARPSDGLTLWHLLARTRGEQRAQVFERFSALVKLPPDVTEAKILKGDTAAFDAAWDALDLGNTDWWREWKRKW